MKKNELRTAAGHVVERVEARMAAPREVGSETQVAGRQLRTGMEHEMALDFLRQLGASAGRHAPGTGSGGARSGSPDGRGGRVDGPARRGGPSRGWLNGPGGQSGNLQLEDQRGSAEVQDLHHRQARDSE